MTTTLQNNAFQQFCCKTPGKDCRLHRDLLFLLSCTLVYDMKRPQDFQDTSIDAPQTKKPKMADGDENGESAGWTKVEKRKRKKATKNEAKLDVCVLSSCLVFMLPGKPRDPGCECRSCSHSFLSNRMPSLCSCTPTRRLLSGIML